jgi:hypothetical protein
MAGSGTRKLAKSKRESSDEVPFNMGQLIHLAASSALTGDSPLGLRYSPLSI